MKVSSIKTVYDFMRYCRMPLWFQRSIRDMKVGDTFILGKYTQPVSHDCDSFCVPPRYSARLDGSEACFVAEAWIEKERGIYSFYATWTFPTKPERAHVMTFGEFRIRKGGIIEFDSKNVEPDDKNHAVKNFALVSRYLSHMLNCMSDEDKKVYFKNNSFPLFNGVWLDSDFNERRQRAVEVDGKIKLVWINYKDYMPTHQLSAIVEAAFATGALQLED
ncbi:TPA: hypothetical protein ACPT1G_004328 [Escherichia coli]|uniref:hypothetical protein n=1 Tax=Enterobacteriaceae TaxID=543 RepID=UPI000D93A5A6|nr:MULTISPECIES: hypothetical protein [Klebsiella/Raoultella group]EIC0238001.1 hypothetical protein [Salmonella enterica subsp. enterica serovar Infantis]EJZ7717529.1 hypothetical protein [Salmonella enterica]QDI11620.1 hypothetical protein electrica_05645 [Klebsiella electrica]SQA60564.1 Uncharacterised protein [Raoultella planticola]